MRRSGVRDVRGGGRASARETVSRVVAGPSPDSGSSKPARCATGRRAYVERVQDIAMPDAPGY